jgi:hypothetical protein
MTGIENRLRQAAESRNSGVIGQALVDIMTEYPPIDLAYLEIQLRLFEGCEVYLISAPNSQKAVTFQSMNVVNHNPTPYWLWICVNGKQEAEAQMKAFNIQTYAENVQRLRSTGFLTTPQGVDPNESH